MVSFPKANSILGEVLQAPDVHLKSLSVQPLRLDENADVDAAFFRALRLQTGLEYLRVRLCTATGRSPPIQDERRTSLFRDALRCLQQLRTLDTNEAFGWEETRAILPKVDDLGLTLRDMTDSWKGPLVKEMLSGLGQDFGCSVRRERLEDMHCCWSCTLASRIKRSLYRAAHR
jgi:hypothetical protein